MSTHSHTVIYMCVCMQDAAFMTQVEIKGQLVELDSVLQEQRRTHLHLSPSNETQVLRLSVNINLYSHK